MYKIHSLARASAERLLEASYNAYACGIGRAQETDIIILIE